MSAPEGHNSQVSMLQGGEEAPIVPSQAGGGNPQESMLQGGEEAPIIPSQAGGDGLKQALQDKFITLPDSVKDTITNYKLNDINEITAVITIVNESESINNDEKADLLYLTLSNLAKNADIDAELQRATDEEKEFLKSRNIINLDKNKKYLALSYFRESKSLKLRSNVLTDSNNESEYSINTDTNIEFYDIDIRSSNVFGETEDNSQTEDSSKTNQVYTDYDLKKINFYMDKVNFDASVDSTKLFKYIEHRNNEWNYLNNDKQSSIKKPQITTNPRKIDENITEFDQYAYCLSKPTANIESHIITIPPINGNTKIFANVLKRLEKIGALTYNKDAYEFKIKNNITIIFMPPFYNFNSVLEEYNNNIKLFNTFIDIWNSNINKIFVLSVSNSNNYVLGAWLFNKLVKKNMDNKWPLTMIEPSYIVYPYRHNNSKPFVISEFNIENVDFALMLNTCKNIKNTKHFSIVVRKQKSQTINSDDIIKITSLNPTNSNATPGFLANLSYSNEKCNGLIETNLNLISISNPFYIQKQTVDYKIGVSIIFVINLNINIKNYKPLCSSSSEFNVDDDNLHIPNSNAEKSGDKEQIIIQDNIYSIRMPTNDIITKNWEEKIFTKDEADFLNVTFLRPKILEAVFGTEWTLYLKEFLYTLTTSKCMKDISLLTNNECYNCRKFINKVERYLTQSNIKKENMQNNYHDRGFKKENEPIENIQGDNIKEAINTELQNRKLSFNLISSYDHINIVPQPNAPPKQIEVRSAFITAVNNKNKSYKFYIISVPKTDNNKNDDKNLMNKLDELKNKYKNFTFVY